MKESYRLREEPSAKINHDSLKTRLSEIVYSLQTNPNDAGKTDTTYNIHACQTSVYLIIG